MVPHYQPCLLVCCLTIGHAFWCGASSSTMPVGVVPHYKPCLLAWYLTIGHAFWSIVTAINNLLVEWRWKKGGYKPGATCTEVPLYQTCLMIRCHSQICLLVQLTTGNAFWRGVSLSAVSAGVLLPYRSRLMAWCLIINHANWCVA